MTAKSKVDPHVFRRDPSIPPDQSGRVTCMCGLIDIPNDPRHTMPDGLEDGRMRAAGDHNDEGD